MMTSLCLQHPGSTIIHEEICGTLRAPSPLYLSPKRVNEPCGYAAPVVTLMCLIPPVLFSTPLRITCQALSPAQRRSRLRGNEVNSAVVNP